MFVFNRNIWVRRLIQNNYSLKSEIRFALTTYLGILVTVISGVLLARHLGANDRGALAFYSNFIFLACFMSSFNFSSGTARVLNQEFEIQKRNKRYHLLKVICIGFLISTSFACFVKYLGIAENKSFRINIFYLLVASGISASSSYFEGIWTYHGNLNFITATRFIGLFVPAFFTIVLVLFDYATIRFLLMSQLLVLLVNHILILKYTRMNRRKIGYPEFRIVFRSSVRGIPGYLIEYLSFWFITYSIMRLDGPYTLGNYAIASSLASAADSIFGASRVKYYKSLIEQNERKLRQLFALLLRSTIPSLSLHLAFIPLAFLIPLVYGPQFDPAKRIAIFLLLVRSLSICSRTIVLYLISIQKDGYSIIIYSSFLIPLLFLSYYSDGKFLGYYWTYSFSYASGFMFLTSLAILFFTSLHNDKRVDNL